MEREYILNTDNSNLVINVCDRKIDEMLSLDDSLVSSVKECITSISRIFNSNRFDIISFEDVDIKNEVRYNILIIFETDKEDIKNLYNKYDEGCWNELPADHKEIISVTNFDKV